MEAIDPPIPTRPGERPYHYHVYDYDGSNTPFDFSAEEIGMFPSNHYYSLVQDLKGLYTEAKRKQLRPELIRLFPRTLYDRHIFALQFGKKLDVKVLFTGGIHAREWLAVEMPYLIAEYLIKNYPDPQANENEMSEKTQVIKELVDNRLIVVVPMINPDGHHNSVFIRDKRNWRKNTRRPFAKLFDDYAQFNQYPHYQRAAPPPPISFTYDAKQYNRWGTRTIVFQDDFEEGIDLNRNFLHKYWGYETYDSNGRRTTGDPTARSDSYFGPYANSEKETQAMTNLITRLNGSGPVAASIDYHAYGKFILHPRKMVPWLNVGDYLSSLITTNPGQPEYQVGPTAKFLYPAFASVMDYCYESHKTSAYTIEVDPCQLPPYADAPQDTIRADYEEKMYARFQPNEDTIQAVFEKNIRGALALISWAGEAKKKRHFQKFVDWNVVGRGNRLPE